MLLRGADASDRARIEIHAEGDAAESTPIAAGRARRPLGVPPGRYRVTVWLREAPTAEGEGVVRNVELPPAGDVALTVDTVFDTGTLLVSTTNRGRAVDDRTRLAIGPHDLSPGRALRFPPGKYEVKATWQSDDGTAHERVETAEVRASQTTKLAIDFGVAAGSLRVLVTDPDGRDLTRDSRVVVETAGGKRVLDASAALDHPLPAGTYKVTVVWSAPPFARALATLPEVVVTASERATLIPVALKARVGTLTFETNHPPDTCKVTLSRAAGTSESAEGLGPFRLPAGTWDARVECGGKSRDVPGLVIAPGKPFVRKLVL